MEEASGFRGLTLHRAYDSGSSDIDVLSDFYLPTLQRAQHYDRLAGFFSSGALAVAARGIAGLISNGGAMRIVASPHFPKNDLKVLRGLDDDALLHSIDGFMAEQFRIDELADEIAKDHVRALAWMLERELLEIRLVVPRHGDDAGEPLFHQKVGILTDTMGDTVSFSGSINETAAGWLENIEEFKVFRSWEPTEAEFLRHDRDMFAKYWECSTDAARAVSLPEAVRRKLLDAAPTDIGDLRLDELTRARQGWSARAAVRLRDYQQKAVDKWFEHDCRGILEMATGTGKTKTAIAALSRLERQKGRQVCVITAPYQHIAVQWAKDLGGKDPLCLFEEGDWKGALANLRSNAIFGRPRHAYICAVQNTAMTPAFRGLLADMAKIFDRCVFVGDEAHGLGAPEMRKALADFYTHRLGLSATPDRWFDAAGTQALQAFFGKTVYRFGIREALDWRDPETGERALCPYDYWPRFVTLDPSEIQQYWDLTQRIIKLMGQDNDPEVVRKRETLLFLRAGIVKQASQKIDALSAILDEASDTSHCLIYCHNTEQMKDVISVVHARGMKYHRFTGAESTVPEERFGGVSEREALIRGLGDGDIDVLVAMKCLDEGVDVPSARLGIILASSSNPREFIQRRGRLLRPSKNKDLAVIYDVVVKPNIDWGADPRVRDLERSIFGKELDRIDDFAQTADNKLDARTQVLQLLTQLY